MQDLMDIKPTLMLVDSSVDVIDETWKDWKAQHCFTSASWDFLLSHLKLDYFKTWLWNDA